MPRACPDTDSKERSADSHTRWRRPAVSLVALVLMGCVHLALGPFMTAPAPQLNDPDIEVLQQHLADATATLPGEAQAHLEERAAAREAAHGHYAARHESRRQAVRTVHGAAMPLLAVAALAPWVPPVWRRLAAGRTPRGE